MADMESQDSPQAQNQQPNIAMNVHGNHTKSKTIPHGHTQLLAALNFALMAAGGAGSPLLLRLYFLKGGARKWLSSFLQTAGFPLALLPLIISYYFRQRCQKLNNPRNNETTRDTKLFFMTFPLFCYCSILGVLIGLDDFLYAFGMTYLPITTSSLLVSTQLGFTALFALVILKQKFTACSINAVVLLSLGAVVLGVNTSGDRPEGEGKGEYYLGLVMTLGAAALYGVLLPLLELTYRKAKQELTLTLVVEMQLVMGFVATVFCAVGMAVNNDFQAIAREAEQFELGEAGYYALLVCSAVMWQCFFLGTVGAIFYSSAMLAGIIMAALIPVTEVLAVIFLHESFTGNKGVALGLSLWGFVSYFYGEFKESKKMQNIVN